MFSNPLPIKPGRGQESVWDYPKPPRLERVRKRLRVISTGEKIAEPKRSYRVLETSHPPTYYFPLKDVRLDLLLSTTGDSYCEHWGAARYWTIEVGGKRSLRTARSYTESASRFALPKD